MSNDEAALAAALYGNTPEHSDTNPTEAPSEVTSDEHKAAVLFGNGPDETPDVFEEAKKQSEEKAAEAAEKDGAGEEDNQDAIDNYESLTDAQKADLIADIAEEHKLIPDHELTANYAEFAARNGIDKKGTQELAALHNEANAQTWTELRNSWAEEATAEFADDAEGLQAAKELLHAHADEELMEIVDGWGLGNHPSLIRFLANVAKSR